MQDESTIKQAPFKQKGLCQSIKRALYSGSQLLGYSLLLSNLTFLPHITQLDRVLPATRTMGAAHAGPTGGNIVGGTGSITQTDLTTTINQDTSRLAIDWNTFNVDSNELVQFIQPDSSSIALNRILDTNASQIFGQIDANGHVVLVNPNGIFFSPEASVNVTLLGQQVENNGLIVANLGAVTPMSFLSTLS